MTVAQSSTSSAPALRVTHHGLYSDITGLTAQQYADLLAALTESQHWCENAGYAPGAEKSKALLEALRGAV